MNISITKELFRRGGYLHLVDVLDKKICRLCYRYMMLKAVTGRFQYPAGDSHIPGAPGEYADPLMEVLLEEIRPLVELSTGIPLFPTFSYCRVYQRGHELLAHNDRLECEIGVTAVMGGEADVPWTFDLEVPDGTVQIAAKAGDIIIYKACEITHKRDQLQGHHQAQVFLFYVNRDGPLSSLKFDRRPFIGLPNETQNKGGDTKY